MSYHFPILNMDIEYAYWLNIEQTLINLQPVIGGSALMDDQSPAWSDIVSSGITVRPMRQSVYHTVWDDINNVWTADQSALTPALKEAIKNERNSKLDSEVEYNSIFAKGSQEEATLLVSIISFLHSKNEDINIDWKQPNGEFVNIPMADIQGLAMVSGQRSQDAFSTEKYILDTHSNTPYEFIQDAIDDFNTYFDNL